MAWGWRQGGGGCLAGMLIGSKQCDAGLLRGGVQRGPGVGGGRGGFHGGQATGNEGV